MKLNLGLAVLAATTLAVCARSHAQDSVPPPQPQDAAPMAEHQDAAPMAQPQDSAPQARSDQAETNSTKDVSTLIKSWPVNSRVTARRLIDKYGPPDAATDERLAWNDHGQWSQIRVFREGATDNFPTTHRDIVENTIQYDVPQDKAGEVIKFYPALDVDRISGTLSSRSDSESANILALNLADEIIRNKRDVDSARGFMRDTLRKSAAGKSSPYMDHLLFPVPSRDEQPRN
jgi:hypothetical protein